jgi:hypothetical protein
VRHEPPSHRDYFPDLRPRITVNPPSNSVIAVIAEEGSISGALTKIPADAAVIPDSVINIVPSSIFDMRTPSDLHPNPPMLL